MRWSSHAARSLGAISFLFGLFGCGHPPPSDLPKKTQRPALAIATSAPQSTKTPTQSAPQESASACSFGVEALASTDIAPGSPAFFYTDRPSLSATPDGLVYGYLDHNKHEVTIARLDSSGAKKSVRALSFPDAFERSHVVSATQGNDIALAYAVYHAAQDADIELSRVDAEDRRVYTKRIAKGPLLAGSPALVWQGKTIAMVWLEGQYPTTTTLKFALIDADTGAVREEKTLATEPHPGTPALIKDGDAYWIGYERDAMRGGIALLKVPEQGETITAIELPSGANPSLLPTPQGIAIAFDAGKRIFFGMYSREGKEILPPKPLPRHPDPFASARKPMLSWNGARFGIAYEVMFHASVMTVHPAEARFVVVSPNGDASPSFRLHTESQEGEMPTALAQGKEWLVVYNRDRLRGAKAPMVVSTRLACAAKETQASAAAGPCDPQHVEIPEALQLIPRDAEAAAARREDGNTFVVMINRATSKPSLLWLDARGKLQKQMELPTNPRPRLPVLAIKKEAMAAGWLTSNGDVDIMIFDASMNQRSFSRMEGDKTTRAFGLAFTPKGLIVAYGKGGAIVTEVIDEKNQRPRQPQIVAKPTHDPGNVALGSGPNGLLLAFDSGTDVSETSVLHAMRLSDDGLGSGAPSLISDAHGFLRSPFVLGTKDGFLVLGTGPFRREIVGIELSPKAEVTQKEKTLLTSYGFTFMSAAQTQKEPRVLGLDGTTIQERMLCPASEPAH